MGLLMFNITAVVLDGPSPPSYFTNNSGWNTKFKLVGQVGSRTMNTVGAAGAYTYTGYRRI